MLQPEKRPVAGPPAWAVPDWPGQAKEQSVQQMFTSIARFYDLNNSLLSFGLHHHWKHTAIEHLTAPPAGACGVRSDESLERRSAKTSRLKKPPAVPSRVIYWTSAPARATWPCWWRSGSVSRAMWWPWT